MKKLIAAVVAALMVLTVIPALTFAATAADEIVYPDPLDGFWSVYRDPDDYNPDAEYYRPTPAYKYTSEGFQVTSADYTNMIPRYTVQTSHPQDLTQGFYMQFRIDEFSYKGENGAPADEWIAVSVSDRPLCSYGPTVHGNNWLALMRGSGDGNAMMVSHLTRQTTDTDKGGYPQLGIANMTVPMDEDGKEIYTMEIFYDGENYDIKLNGVSVPGASQYSKHIKSFEECYVGLTFHSGVVGGVASTTILKQGTNAANAETPDGTDEGEAEDNILHFGDPVEPSTVPAGQPALLWNAMKQSFKGDPNRGAFNVVLAPTANYTYHLAASASDPYFIWSIKSELTYMAEDFPIFAMLIKDYMGNDGFVRYCVGDVMSADDTHLSNWSMYDDACLFYGAEDQYSLVVVDLSLCQDWEGRINSLRPEFVVDANDEEWSEWDIEFMGMFRSVEDVHAYSNAYVEELQLETEPPVTEAPTESEAVTEAPTAPETEAATAESEASGTTAETAASTSASTEGEEKSGCSSSVGIGMSAMALLLAAAVVWKKKN